MWMTVSACLSVTVGAQNNLPNWHMTYKGSTLESHVKGSVHPNLIFASLLAVSGHAKTFFFICTGF